MQDVSFIELTFIMHLIGSTISSFIQNLFNFILSAFFTTRTITSDNNYWLIQSLSKYVIKNRTNIQSDCYTLIKSRDDIDGFYIDGQMPRLSSGVTFFWHGKYLYWVVCDSSNSRNYCNLKLCSFRWCSNDMNNMICELNKNIDPPKLYIYFDGYWQDTVTINPLTDKTYMSDGNTLKSIDDHIKII